jgi:predicted enzyme related to lactoylglutathione lyase
MYNAMNFLGLVVKDVPAATQFYTQSLGLTGDEAQSIPNMYTQFKLNGGATLGLINGFEQAGIDSTFDAALSVADVDAVYTRLQAAGVDMVSEPHDMPFGRTFQFRTPDGHVLRVFRNSK